MVVAVRLRRTLRQAQGRLWGTRVFRGLEVEGEAPEGEGGGEDVGVGERALRIPDWIGGGEQGGGDRGGRAEEIARETEDRKQSGGRDHADEGACSAGNES